MIPKDPHWAQGREENVEKRHSLSGSTTSSVRQAIHFMGATGQENALFIADGVKAWKTLTDGKGPLWRRFNERRSNVDESSRRGSANHPAEQKSDTSRSPQDHPPTNKEESGSKECPFQSMAQLGHRQDAEGRNSIPKRPDSLPTPPPAQDSMQDPIHSNVPPPDISPPPSVTGSASKCPIRMLDERSPEEIAEYFEEHKHEIPRSHEICVKRYQTNAESIRQLDATYGNLINMIQGLGMKHQPLLSAKEDPESYAEMDAKSARKVEKWADNVRTPLQDEQIAENQAVESQKMHNNLVEENDRRGHFDRPLKEIRVGESPSRPWGISAPGPGPPLQDHSKTSQTAAATTRPARVSSPRMKARPASNDNAQRTVDEQPRMVFTGPVFIGYSAEQAAALIQKCGWDPSGPSTTNA